MVKDNNIFLAGDLQCSSQVGSISKFRNFSLLCPNERELRIALQDKESGLESLSRKLLDLTNTSQLIMKLGSEGFIAYERVGHDKFHTQAFPALSVNPLDVAGAGDSLLSVMACGLSKGESIMTSSALGCCMASIAVETMGNTPVSAEKLKAKVREILIGTST